METISITNCPTCNALAQTLPGDKWRSVESVHAIYDSVRELYSLTFGKTSEDLSIPEVMESLMWNAEHERGKTLR